MHKIFVICVVFILAIGGAARSQFTQYTAPGSAAKAPKDAAESAQEGAENARWKIGPLRIAPHLTVSNVGYSQNVFSAPEGTTQVDDFRATLGAGLAGYLRLGSKSVLSGFVGPEYSTWRDTEDLRQLGVNSGLGWFASFNRLTLSASARSIERERLLSAEIEAPVQIAQDQVSLDTTLEITRRLAIFAVASDSKLRHARDIEQFVPGLDLRDLDRDDSRRLVGLELRGSDVAIRLGYETTDVDFADSDSRDNSGKGASVRLRYDRSKLNVYLSYSDLRIDFDDLARPDLERILGTANVAFRMKPKTTVTAYATDGLAFSVISSSGIIESEYRGLALGQSLSQRLEMGAFAEVGRQTFLDDQNLGRVDDLEAFGLMIRFDLTEGATLTGQVREETWDSTIDDFDRLTSSIGFGIEFGGDLLPW